MQKEDWLTVKAIGSKAQIEELLGFLNRHYAVITSSPLLENDNGGFHIFLRLFKKQREVEVFQA